VGRRKGDATYAERAQRIAQLLDDLITLEENVLGASRLTEWLAKNPSRGGGGFLGDQAVRVTYNLRHEISFFFLTLENVTNPEQRDGRSTGLPVLIVDCSSTR
jgi:hypothetical protein